MPICPNCKSLLPPSFFYRTTTEDDRCEFCIREKNVLHYTENLVEKVYDKKEAEREYKIFLKKMSERPNISSIIEIIKNKNSIKD